MDIPPIIVTGGIFPPSGNILKEIRRGGSIHENGKYVKATHGIMLCLLCVNPLHPRILHCYSLALFENLVWRVFGMSLFSFPLPGMQPAMVDASASASNHPPCFPFIQSFPPCVVHFENLYQTIFMSPFPSPVYKRQCIGRHGTCSSAGIPSCHHRHHHHR